MSAIPVIAGHTVSMALSFLDQNGHPMQTPPTPDALPVWSDTAPTVGTLTPVTNGMSASEVTLLAGVDTVTVALKVGGVAFTASVELDVSAMPQVLTSIEIVTSVG